MKILYDNQVPNATISAFSENPNFLFSDALNDTVLARTGRTIGDSSEWIKFSFSSAVAVTDFCILNHNFEAGAVVYLQGNATDVWTSPSVNRLQTISDVIYDTFASQSYQYWRVSMAHSASTAGYFYLSKIFLGTAYTPVNPDAGIDMPYLVEPMIAKSRGGQIYGQAATVLKSHNITMSNMSQTEVANYRTFADTVNNNTPFVFIPFESSTSTIPPYYANAMSHGQLRLNEDHGVSYSMAGINYQECK